MLKVLRRSRLFCRFPYQKWPFSNFVTSSVRRMSMKRLKLYPALPEEVIEDMETVVVLNLMNDRVSWLVEDHNRRILDYREEILFQNPNYVYNHALYQEKLMEVVSELPNSSIYVFEGSKKYFKAASFMKYIVHRAYMEGILITLINATKGQTKTRRKAKDELTNKVYMYLPINYKTIYDLVVAGEDLSAYPIVEELIKDGRGPLAGLDIPSSIYENHFSRSNTKIKEVFSRTLLKADSVIKFCLETKLDEEEKEEG